MVGTAAGTTAGSGGTGGAESSFMPFIFSRTDEALTLPPLLNLGPLDLEAITVVVGAADTAVEGVTSLPS